MLVAKLNGHRVEATGAARGLGYRCPGCEGDLVLKQGPIVIAHFAHKPPTSCEWASAETIAHLQAKRLMANALRGRGLKAEVEFIVDTLPGDRRADVMTWRPDGQMVAIEFQHTPISLSEIERRAFSYARANIAQIWIPFLNSTAWRKGTRAEGGYSVRRYSPQSFEKWVHGLHAGYGMWMYDPKEQHFWHARLHPHEVYVEESSWYGEGGEERSAGGYYRTSKRYRDLALRGPFQLDAVRISLNTRFASSLPPHRWPAGKIGYFTKPR